MQPILTRCGFRCDLCLAFRPNIEQHPENRQKVSDGWFTYFGFRIPPEEILCDGCMTENAIYLDHDCPVRPCVIEKGLENCSQCGQYICEKLSERLVTFEEIQQRLKVEIPEDDYQSFIRPFENKRRLEALRKIS